MKALSVIGLHNSGKTTAVEAIIKYIRSRNMGISSIKDIHQENFSMEKPGSNSQRHLLASQSSVFARGTHETYLIWNRQLSFKEMLNHINTEWLIIEGMKELPLPKIIAAKNREEIDLLYDETVFAITGPYAEQHKEYNGIPCINAIAEGDKLGDLVLQKVFELLPFAHDGYCGHCGHNCSQLTAMILKGEKTREDCGIKKSNKIKITFDDEEIFLNEWVETLLSDMITSLCKNLKGYKKGVRIRIDN